MTSIGKMPHSTCRCDNHPSNCALLLGGICITAFESRAIGAPGRHGVFRACNLVAHAMMRCSMKRRSTIYGIQSSFAGLREDKDARTVIKEHGGEG
jgi:hypothetical protein